MSPKLRSVGTKASSTREACPALDLCPHVRFKPIPKLKPALLFFAGCASVDITTSLPARSVPDINSPVAANKLLEQACYLVRIVRSPPLYIGTYNGHELGSAIIRRACGRGWGADRRPGGQDDLRLEQTTCVRAAREASRGLDTEELRTHGADAASEEARGRGWTLRLVVIEGFLKYNG